MQQPKSVPRLEKSTGSEKDRHSNGITTNMEAHGSGLRRKKNQSPFSNNAGMRGKKDQLLSKSGPDKMYGSLNSKAFRVLRRACRRAINRAFYQGQQMQLRELKQISVLMTSAVQSLQLAKGEVVKTIHRKEAAGIAPLEKIPLTPAVQKELGQWDDFLRVVVEIISENHNGTKTQTCANGRSIDRYYTVRECNYCSKENKIMYKIIQKDSTEEFDRFYYDWSIPESVQPLLKGDCTQTENTPQTKSVDVWNYKLFQDPMFGIDNMNNLINEADHRCDLKMDRQNTSEQKSASTEIHGQHTAENDTQCDFSVVKSIFDSFDS